MPTERERLVEEMAATYTIVQDATFDTHKNLRAVHRLAMSAALTVVEAAIRAREEVR